MGKVWEVLNLGSGVQSTTLLLMSIKGLLPKFDCAIFADTQYEPRQVYDHLGWLEQEAMKASIPVHRVTRGNLKQDALEFMQQRRSCDGKRFASIPAFVRNPDGTMGKLQRQCTKEYKIECIEEFIRREILGLRWKQKAPKHVVCRQWFGISGDERQRMREPATYSRQIVGTYVNLFGDEEPVYGMVRKPALWKENVYPLCRTIMGHDGPRQVDYLPMDFTRDLCKAWLRSHYPERQVPRSACICCPFRSNQEWKLMREEDPDSWQEAVAFDRAIRERDQEMQRTRGTLYATPYVHRSLVPLDQVQLDEIDPSLFATECEGMCGV